MKHTTGTSGNRFLRWQGDTWWAILSNHLGLGTCKVKQGDTLCHRITRGLAQPSRQLIYHSVPDSSSRTASDAAPPQPPSLSAPLAPDVLPASAPCLSSSFLFRLADQLTSRSSYLFPPSIHLFCWPFFVVETRIPRRSESQCLIA